MAAQGSERKFNICDRCFASVPIAQPFCPECGAPIVTEEHHTEGSDSAVYTELARANLLRMRGDYRQAEEQCLNILKRFPNNSSANTLLGDISAEQGDLTQAVQWYELSLDLNPGDDAVKMKLKSVQERIAVHETAATAKELGLPITAANKNKYIFAIIGMVLAVAASAYFFGSKEGAAQAAGPTRTPPIKVPKNTTGSDTGGDTGGSGGDGGGGDVPLYKRILSATPDGEKVLAVFQDPRNKAVTISYSVGELDARPLGARLARSVMDVEADTLNVNVRAMRDGNLVYTADVLRSRLNETITQAWKAQNQSEPNAWIDYILMNEWFAPSAKKPEPALDQQDEDQKKQVDSTPKESDSSGTTSSRDSKDTKDSRPAKTSDDSASSDKSAPAASKTGGGT